MDWTTFLLGAIAGVIFWNKLNPKVRDVICSLFSQDVETSTPTQAPQESAAEPKKSEALFQAVITKAYNDGKNRKTPDIPKEMYEDASPLTRYLYLYLMGFIKFLLSRMGVPAAPTTQQQI